MSNHGVSKAVLSLVLDIAGAIPSELNPPAGTPIVVDAGGFYTGPGVMNHYKATMQMFKAGVLQCHGEDDHYEIKLTDRDGFLLSFRSGAREAANGNGIGYIDYSDCPVAFAAGYMHWHNRQKKGVKPYIAADFNVCHGFTCADTGNEWLQL